MDERRAMAGAGADGRAGMSESRQRTFDVAADQHERARRASSQGGVAWLPVVGGGLLAGAGLARGQTPLALLGGGLVYWGVSRGVAALPGSPAAALAPDGERSARVEKVVTINKPVETVYAAWRDIERLPEIMSHLESVTLTADGLSHWVAKAPFGQTVSWDAEVINDDAGRVIAWRSVEGSEIQNVGAVHFHEAPGGRGTELRVRIEYTPPAGGLGATVAKLFGEEPSQQVADDLRRFKARMETGECPTTDGQPRGAHRGSLMDAGLRQVRRTIDAANEAVSGRP